MTHLRVPAALQHVQEADEVGIAIGVRVVDRVAHAGLGGQVRHGVEAMPGKERRDPFAGSHIQLDKLKPGKGRQPGKARPLETDVVVVVEAVDADHPVAALQQGSAQCGAYEPGRAGD